MRPGIVLGKVVILTAAYVTLKFQHKPLHKWYLHKYADRPYHGHWCTPIPSQRQFFTLFLGNSLDGLFYLWHVEFNVRFCPKTTYKCRLICPENTFPLSFGQSQMTLHPENSAAFLHKIIKCLPLCKLHFLMQQWTVLSDNDFSKYSCGYVHHGSMTASAHRLTHQNFPWLSESW